MGVLRFATPALEKWCFCPHDVPDAALQMGQRYGHAIASKEVAKSYVAFVSEQVGQGLFADRDFKKGEWIGEYGGLVREQSALNPMSDYAFRYPVRDETGRYLEIDAEHFGNHTRFINHCARPNLLVKTAFAQGLYHVILITARSICRDEQFAYDYGKGYWLLRGAAQTLL